MTIALTLKPHAKDLGGGFMVRRLLPAAQRQSIGPFIFFDHFGPVTAGPDDNHDVRPHPHIGLATVTYLFEGAMMHRDSLGSVQRIEPGAINWMTAGRGIVHSERTPDDLRTQTRRSHGLQLWCALPAAFEETHPAFVHTAAHAIPQWQWGGTQVRVLIGTATLGNQVLTSPVQTFAPTLYLDVIAGPGSSFTLAADAPERAIYSVDNALAVDGEPVEPFELVQLPADGPVQIEAPQGARYVVIGGAPLDGHRFIWWNFVSSRKERVVQAGAEWDTQQMGQVPGETEWIPLPATRPV
jgi:redox-sensitive bicupin YhaK (pirin superfamily)